MRNITLLAICLLSSVIAFNGCSLEGEPPPKIITATGVPYGIVPCHSSVTFVLETEEIVNGKSEYDTLICRYYSEFSEIRCSDSFAALLQMNAHLKIHDKITVTGYYDGPIFIVQFAKIYEFLIDRDSIKKEVPKELEQK